MGIFYKGYMNSCHKSRVVVSMVAFLAASLTSSWAEPMYARVNGDSVVVWSKDEPKPVAVRYGWSDFGFFNLFNRAGLPAPPFCSEDARL